MRAIVLAFLLALPAYARRQAEPKKRHVTARVRPEDDPRKRGNSKAFARARVRFAAPKDRSEIGDEKPLQVDLRVSGYALGALSPGARPSHAHLFLDGEPPLDVDDASKPFLLAGVAPGPHVLRAVLCRPWHEVVKAPHAFAMTRFWMGKRLEGRAGKAAQAAVWPDPRRPILTLVLPLGSPPRELEILRREHEEEAVEPPEEQHAALVGAPDFPSVAADRPVVDFYLANARVGRRGDKVRVVLDRRELPLLTDWKPLRLRTHRGRHKVTLDLLDRRGLDVKNAVNRTERHFEVR